MRLTEREKWLMQQAWVNAIEFHGTFQYWLESTNNGVESIEHELCAYSPKNKSIVKKVDADNLPDCEVLAFNGLNLLIGLIDYDHFGGVYTCGESDSLDNPTHYIGQKDLIELITGAGK